MATDASVTVESLPIRKAFYTPADVAKILSVSDQTVLTRIHEGDLFAVRVSPRVYRIPLGALLQFLGARPRIRRRSRQDVDVMAEDEALGLEHADKG